jgi:hypothetical protein
VTSGAVFAARRGSWRSCFAKPTCLHIQTFCNSTPDRS